MPRSRFDRLPAEQRNALERAALAEFAGHGFHDASLNRMIESAGISKGSLYYYFDGKEDLFAHVVAAGLRELFERTGPFPIPTATDPDGYWAELAEAYQRSMAVLSQAPELAALLRGWMAAAGTPAGQQILQGLLEVVTPWMEQTVAGGQRVGAVRTDVPTELILAVAGGMGQAMDTWLLQRRPDPGELPELARLLIGMLRGALRPDDAPAT